jgi:hypothetical protein
MSCRQTGRGRDKSYASTEACCPRGGGAGFIRHSDRRSADGGSGRGGLGGPYLRYQYKGHHHCPTEDGQGAQRPGHPLPFK